MSIISNYRFFSILDGASITNEDTTDSSVQYFGYTRPGGSWVIMRIMNVDTATPSYSFYAGADIPKPFENSTLAGYDLAWADHTNLSYRRSGEFKDL